MNFNIRCARERSRCLRRRRRRRARRGIKLRFSEPTKVNSPGCVIARRRLAQPLTTVIFPPPLALPHFGPCNIIFDAPARAWRLKWLSRKLTFIRLYRWKIVEIRWSNIYDWTAGSKNSCSSNLQKKETFFSMFGCKSLTTISAIFVKTTFVSVGTLIWPQKPRER